MTEGLKVRTVTAFVTLAKDDAASWAPVLQHAARAVASVAAALQKAGFSVQTIRLATQPFGEYLDTSTADAACAQVAKLHLQELQVLAPEGIPVLISLGPARTLSELEAVPSLIATHNVTVSTSIDVDELGVADSVMARAAAVAMQRIGDRTAGGGLFNFAAGCRVYPGTPFFPVAYADQHQTQPSIAIGLEFPALLAAAARAGVSEAGAGASRSAQWAAAAKRMTSALNTAISAIAGIASAAAAAAGYTFAGVDTSLAPSTDSPASVVDTFHALGVPYFGAPGTLEACAFLTRVLKSVTAAPLVGYCGLMLPPCEDRGLAAAAAAAQYTLRDLLTFSAVCGIGLDTVPVPADTPVESMTALLCDVTALAFRLNKPLSVRLLLATKPREQGDEAADGPKLISCKQGEIARFDNPYLCDTTVFSV